MLSCQGFVIEFYDSFFVWSASSLGFSWGCLQNLSLTVIFSKAPFEAQRGRGKAYLHISKESAKVRKSLKKNSLKKLSGKEQGDGERKEWEILSQRGKDKQQSTLLKERERIEQDKTKMRGKSLCKQREIFNHWRRGEQTFGRLRLTTGILTAASSVRHL